MKYAFFQGCNIPIRIQQYSEATTEVLKVFGIELQAIDEFNCCGYPMRNVDEKSYLMPSVRNLALAEQAGLDILVICNCCYQSLKKAQHVLTADESLRIEINEILSREGLTYSGKAVVKHYLAVLHNDVGVEKIKQQLKFRYKGLNSAVLHGCHLLRPREIVKFDDSFVPTITEELLRVAGATSLDWQGKMECCGAALAGFNDTLADQLLDEKLAGAQFAGADFITPICSYCHLQLDTAQLKRRSENPEKEVLPVLLYPQLLGLCLGIDASKLGIKQNKTVTEQHLTALTDLLGPPVEEKKRRRKAKSAA